jgi:hypothetical protein
MWGHLAFQQGRSNVDAATGSGRTIAHLQLEALVGEYEAAATLLVGL